MIGVYLLAFVWFNIQPGHQPEQLTEPYPVATYDTLEECETEAQNFVESLTPEQEKELINLWPGANAAGATCIKQSEKM